jgi:hypothetical protein
MARRRRRSGVNRSDKERLKRKLPSLGTALARRTKQALKTHGQVWFSRMARQFRAPLTPYGQVNTNRTLHNRSNFMRNSLRWRVTGTRLADLGLDLTSNHPGARLQEYGGVVRARRGMLAIPIDDALTPAGVRKYGSPTDPEIADGFFLEIPSGLYYVRRTGRQRGRGVETRGDLQFLFALRREVEIPGPRAPRRRQPSRLGFRENAIGKRARVGLRKRLVLAQQLAVQDATGGKRKR